MNDFFYFIFFFIKKELIPECNYLHGLVWFLPRALHLPAVKCKHGASGIFERKCQIINAKSGILSSQI